MVKWDVKLYSLAINLQRFSCRPVQVNPENGTVNSIMCVSTFYLFNSTMHIRVLR